MYAIIEVGGRQWKVEPGTRIEVNRLASAVGSQLPIERVLLAHDGSRAQVGQPYVPGATVVCEVLEHHRGPKAISYHFRRRENWRKTVGHRQPLTRLLVKDIVLAVGQTSATAAGAVTPASATKRSAPKVVRKRTTSQKPSSATKKTTG